MKQIPSRLPRYRARIKLRRAELDEDLRQLSEDEDMFAVVVVDENCVVESCDLVISEPEALDLALDMAEEGGHPDTREELQDRLLKTGYCTDGEHTVNVIKCGS